jgi:hypothetical protein
MWAVLLTLPLPVFRVALLSQATAAHAAMTKYQLLQLTKSWGSKRDRRALAGN